jgi:glycosyltransferase involved in cell wall biosynthesis
VKPLSVSVVIPTYNRAHLLPRAIDSVLANVLPGDEVIVADDASTDHTRTVLAGYGNRLRHLILPHGGAGAARNRGIENATCDLVAFLDSDDEWMPDKLALQRALMERRPELVYCFSEFAVREGETTTPRYLINWHQDARGWDEILGPGVAYSSIASLPAGRADFRVHVGNLFAGELERDYVLTSSFVVRRVAAGAALRFAEDVATFEDWECFGRVLAQGPGAYLDCESVWQIGHAGPRLSMVHELHRANSRLTIMKRVWGQNIEFMKQHGDAYSRVLQANHLLRARCLLHQGETRQAREDLRHAGASPLGYRVLASLPGKVAKALLAMRRLLRVPSLDARS